MPKNMIGEGFPHPRALVDEMHKYGAAIMQVELGDFADPDDDTLVIVVQGRDEIKDIKNAVKSVEDYWTTLQDDEDAVVEDKDHEWGESPQ